MNATSQRHLADAAHHVRRACLVLRRESRRFHIAMARVHVALARKAFADALQAAHVRHAYAKDGASWRGVLLAADGATAWRSCRVYAHRQSAQRAALAAMAGWLTPPY